MNYSQTKMLGLILLLIGLALASLGLSWLIGMPQFQATVRIKLEPDVIDIDGVSGLPAASFDPYFVQTTFEIMQSEVVLSNVVSALNLETAWGKKFAGGKKLSVTEAIDLLKRQITLAPVRNTKIIAISVRSDDPNEAAKIANTIVDVYAEYMVQSRKQIIEKGLKILEQQYDEQSLEIQVMMTNVDKIRKSLGISGIASAASSTLTEEQIRDLSQQVTEDTRDYKQLVDEVNQLKTYDKTKLRDVLPAISEDNELSELLVKLHEAELWKNQIDTDSTFSNQVIIRARSSVDSLNRQIDERVAGIMAGFDAKVKAKKDAIAAITKTLDEAKAKELANAGPNQPYYEAKRKLADLMDQHRLFYAKMESDRIDAQIPKTSFVQIVDIAVPPKSPIGPNRFLGAVMLAVGLITALGGWLLLRSGREVAG